ncbi:MAG: tRNA-dihydrouridine synthase [Candidatus Pacebacteria bacterium]|jgi:nifR3 family TIM-barrel protein|nr:tRNA-dihydrouridine synthase [Candidatus Paceibacterota bacterium]MBP9701015.1 tRNA-dihydrouridine synthase [Candidatus Paceibacterota bacterium]
MTFWNELQKKKQPFFCVAPMADVTDAAFRRLITKYGKPDVMWTEFVSANGLMSAGRAVLKRDLEYSEGERPIVAQLFSSDPVMMEGAARLAAELGFDGIDINMGCPDKTIEKQGAGAAMMKAPEKALEIIRAAKRGIVAAGKDIPVSVKTRVGYSDVQIDTWIPMLLAEGISALTVHARTRKDLSLVPANWNYLKKVVELRDKLAPETVIIGNGDVTSLADGRAKAVHSGVDGVMVGRALFGNPWFFDASREVVAALPQKSIFRNVPILKKFFDTKRTAPTSVTNPITTKERLTVLVEHTKLFEELLGDIKSFAIMKKHFKAYCTGFKGAKELRIQLMETKNGGEVEQRVEEFLTKN